LAGEAACGSLTSQSIWRVLRPKKLKFLARKASPVVVTLMTAPKPLLINAQAWAFFMSEN
jgi:hypothetical protein